MPALRPSIYSVQPQKLITTATQCNQSDPQQFTFTIPPPTVTTAPAEIVMFRLEMVILPRAMEPTVVDDRCIGRGSPGPRPPRTRSADSGLLNQACSHDADHFQAPHFAPAVILPRGSLAQRAFHIAFLPSLSTDTPRPPLAKSGRSGRRRYPRRCSVLLGHPRRAFSRPLKWQPRSMQWNQHACWKP